MTRDKLDPTDETVFDAADGDQERAIRIVRHWDGTTEEGEVPRPGYRNWLGYVIQRDTASDLFVWVTLGGTKQAPIRRGNAPTVEAARIMIQVSTTN